MIHYVQFGYVGSFLLVLCATTLSPTFMYSCLHQHTRISTVIYVGKFSGCISTNYIFSATVASLSLRAGSALHASGGTLTTISGGVVHGSYSSSTLDNDIAVLRASSAFPIGSTTVRTVSLLGSGSSPSTGATAWVSGWGTTAVSIW